MSVKAEIKKTLRDLLSESTSHGIPRIIKSKKRFMKLLWIIFFLISAGYCTNLVFSSFFDYLKFDHITSVDIEFTMPAAFPAVTICNLNRFQSNETIKLANSYFNGLPSINRIFYLLNEISFYNDTAKNSISYPFNESLIGCLFNGRRCYAYEFEWLYHFLYGNCFRFNSGRDSFGNPQNLSSISNPGGYYGLNLELFLGDSESTSNIIQDLGYRVMITNQTSKPLLNEGFDVAPNIHTNINVNRFYNYRLEYPYNDCKSNLNTIDAFDSDLYRSIIKSNLTYRQIDCFYLCYQKKVIETCNCYHKAYSLTSQIPCLDIKQLICASDVWNNFITSDIKKECTPYCPSECDTVSYTISTSFSEYPSKAYAETVILNNPIIKQKFPNQNITYEQIKKNVLSLTVYYDQLSYTVTSQQGKIDLLGLISNIGGFLGLFLGISFLSLVEIFEAVFEVLCIIFRKI